MADRGTMKCRQRARGRPTLAIRLRKSRKHARIATAGTGMRFVKNVRFGGLVLRHNQIAIHVD